MWVASVYESLYRVRKRSRVVWQKQEDGAKHREKKARLIFATRVNLLGRAGAASGRVGTTVRSLRRYIRYFCILTICIQYAGIRYTVI